MSALASFIISVLPKIAQRLFDLVESGKDLKDITVSELLDERERQSYRQLAAADRAARAVAKAKSK